MATHETRSNIQAGSSNQRSLASVSRENDPADFLDRFVNLNDTTGQECQR
jgi:hypothetical protein